MELARWIVAIAALLAPKTDVTDFAATLATVAKDEPPLFAEDTSRAKTAALMTAVAYRESSFDLGAVSKTDDHCWFGVHARPDLAKDGAACARVALAMMRESMRACPAHPVAFYAEGPRGCTSRRAQRISLDRMSLAQWIAGKVGAP